MSRVRGFLLALVMASPAAAVLEPVGPTSIAGVEFAGRVLVDETPLLLHGVGTLKRFFLTGYAAGLYLGEDVPAPRVLEDVPKRLELHYFYAIGAEKFGPAADEVLARHFDPLTLEGVRERIDRVALLYEDVSPGDRYTLTYLPGRGTELAKNGEVLGVVPGADFASVYFSIWLGQEPIDDDLRAQLLRPASS